MVTPGCMTEESDSENGEKIVLHPLLWRSECESCDSVMWYHVITQECLTVLNQFVQKLDNRYERSLKTTKSSTVKRDRVLGLASSSQPPQSLPSWMIDPTYKRPTPLATTPTVCMESTVDPENTSCVCLCVCVCACVCVHVCVCMCVFVCVCVHV